MTHPSWIVRAVRRARRAAATGMLLSAAGCSVFAGSRDTVVVRATEPDAILFADGMQIGRGTAEAEVKCNDSHTYTAVLGSRIGRASTGTRLSVTGWLDLLFGFVLLVPLIGFATPGAFTVDHESVLIIVPEK